MDPMRATATDAKHVTFIRCQCNGSAYWWPRLAPRRSDHEQFANLSVIPRSAWEPWLIFRKPFPGLVRENLAKWKTGALRRPSKDIPFKDFIESATTRNAERDFADHPSLKPQAFLRQVVAASLPLGRGVVVDPFAGSGSTLAAAEALNLRSIGIEINPTYFNMAKKAIPKLATYRNGSVGGATASAVRKSRTI